MEAKEIKELTDKINAQWGEMKDFLKTTVTDETKKFGALLGDTNAKLDGFTKRMDEMELKFQRAAQFQAAQKFDKPKSEAYPIFMKALRLGAGALTVEERKLMTAVDATTGNFAANPEFDAEIIKGIV